MTFHTWNHGNKNSNLNIYKGVFRSHGYNDMTDKDIYICVELTTWSNKCLHIITLWYQQNMYMLFNKFPILKENQTVFLPR